MYRAAGFETRHARPDVVGPDASAFTAVLVDDAHDLDDVSLERLRELAERGESHLVVAHRPWPRSRALRALLATLDLHHPPVALGPMARDEVAVAAAQRRGQPVAAAVVDALTDVTAGMPWLVQRVVATWPRDGVQVAPAAVLAQLGRELEHLDDGLRDLLLDLAVGFSLSGAAPPPALDRDLSGTEDLVARGEAAGLLTARGAIVPLVGEALVAATPAHRVRARQRALLAAMDGVGRPLDGVARRSPAPGWRTRAWPAAPWRSRRTPR